MFSHNVVLKILLRNVLNVFFSQCICIFGSGENFFQKLCFLTLLKEENEEGIMHGREIACLNNKITISLVNIRRVGGQNPLVS